MKNIFNIDEGTIIVEDILSPQAAPELNYAQFQTQVEAFGGIAVAEELGLPVPPKDASGYAIPTLAKWSDIVFLQLLRLGSRPDVQRIIQYHVSTLAAKKAEEPARLTVIGHESDYTGNPPVIRLFDQEAARPLCQTSTLEGW